MSDAASRDRSSPQERTLAMVVPVLDRLRNVVEAENRELAMRGPVDYPSHSQRKNQALLELSRLRGAIAGIRSHPAFGASLADLMAKLDVNERLLSTQLRAARTISGIVTRAIRDGQSDGTYSAYPWRDDD